MDMKEETRRLVITRRNAIPSDERIAAARRHAKSSSQYFSRTVAFGARIAAYHAMGSEVDIAPIREKRPLAWVDLRLSRHDARR